MFLALGLMCAPRNQQIICKLLQCVGSQRCMDMMDDDRDSPAPSKDGHGTGNVVGNQVSAAKVDGLLLKNNKGDVKAKRNAEIPRDLAAALCKLGSFAAPRCQLCTLVLAIVRWRNLLPHRKGSTPPPSCASPSSFLPALILRLSGKSHRPGSRSIYPVSEQDPLLNGNSTGPRSRQLLPPWSSARGASATLTHSK